MIQLPFSCHVFCSRPITFNDSDMRRVFANIGCHSFQGCQVVILDQGDCEQMPAYLQCVHRGVARRQCLCKCVCVCVCVCVCARASFTVLLSEGQNLHSRPKSRTMFHAAVTVTRYWRKEGRSPLALRRNQALQPVLQAVLSGRFACSALCCGVVYLVVQCPCL